MTRTLTPEAEKAMANAKPIWLQLPQKRIGNGFAFLQSLVGHTGQDCVPWPFTCTRDGYAMCALRGTQVVASRLMCEMVYGRAPSPQHDAAHTCGKRDCVNPNHLRWKGHQANMAEMVDQGTARKKGTPRRILTGEQVAEIRASDRPYQELAERYGVKWGTIKRIVSGHDRPDRPLRHGAQYTGEQRAKMIATAQTMRLYGASYGAIAEVIGCSRSTAKAFAHLPP